jgi:hypothetical protein
MLRRGKPEDLSAVARGHDSWIDIIIDLYSHPFPERRYTLNPSNYPSSTLVGSIALFIVYKPGLDIPDRTAPYAPDIRRLDIN